MNATKKELAARRAALTRLATHLRRHPVLAGTLAKVARGGVFRYQLTDRPGGKARILYVPADMAEEVEEWTENWRKAKALLLALSELTHAEMRRRGPGRGRGGRPSRGS